MSIKSDNWIRRMAREHGMIEPFEPGQVRSSEQGRLISYGTSSYGYDVRCAPEFKIFTNINSTIVDPKRFDEKSFVDMTGDVCIIPPNSFALARTVEYFRVPRNALVICLGKSTYARCFRGDTRVALVDGTASTLEQMAHRHERGELFWGYSIGARGQLMVTLLDQPRFIGRDGLIEIVLDNGERIHATPDHSFLKRDGSFVLASELRPGASLMPLYRGLRRGYEHVYQPLSGHMFATHRLSDDWNVRNGIYDAEPGTHRHHIYVDRPNNLPTNLTRMPGSEHIRLHNSETYGPDFDPSVHGATISSAFDRLAGDQAWRDKRLVAIRERLLADRRNPTADCREAHRQAALRRYADPTERIRHAASMRAAWRNSNDSRRLQQAELARQLNLRSEITEQVLRRALDDTGSIRGAARYLHCDRSVFRRFPEVLAALRGTPNRNHKVVAIRETPGEHDVYCLTVPEAGNFALEAGVFVHNCGIIVNVTPLEPEWEGHVTLEFSNTTTLPAKIYANEGVAQMLFFESDEICSTSYADRGGKYQGQKGVTLPKA